MARRTANARNQNDKPLKVDRLVGALDAHSRQAAKPETMIDSEPAKPIPAVEQLSGVAIAREISGTVPIVETIAKHPDKQLGGIQHASKLVLLTTSVLSYASDRYTQITTPEDQDDLWDAARAIVLLASNEQPALHAPMSLGTPSITVDSDNGFHTVRLMFSHNAERARALKKARSAVLRSMADFGYNGVTNASHGFIALGIYSDRDAAREVASDLGAVLPSQPLQASEALPLVVSPIGRQF